MRLVFAFVLLVGVALAGLAAYMAQNYVGQYRVALARANAANQQSIKTVPVLVASLQLKYGQSLTPEDVRLVNWPDDAIPEGAFQQADVLFPSSSNDPRIVLRTMEKDEAIMAVKVTEPGEDAGITSQLARGMRAFAIKVDVSSGVSGFLRPGDRVDVYWTGSFSGFDTVENAPSGDFTKLIEAGVQLIAVDQTADTNASGARIARTVTVSVRPEQVASLAQAQSTGRLSLSLVGTGDDSVAEVVEVDQRKLLGLTAAAAVTKPAQQEVCTIRQRRGAEVIESPIPCTN